MPPLKDGHHQAVNGDDAAMPAGTLVFTLTIPRSVLFLAMPQERVRREVISSFQVTTHQGELQGTQPGAEAGLFSLKLGSQEGPSLPANLGTPQLPGDPDGKSARLAQLRGQSRSRSGPLFLTPKQQLMENSNSGMDHGVDVPSSEGVGGPLAKASSPGAPLRALPPLGAPRPRSGKSQ